MILARVLAVVIGYCFGLFQTSFFYGKMHGIDIRKAGSGNAGTTNALRTLGKKAGLIVLIGDVVKCILAIVLIWLLFGRSNPDYDYLLRVYTGAGCILGHNYPFYMNFKGGKGVACTAGLIISTSPIMVLIGVILFFGTVTLTHYVSLGSLLVGAMLMIGSVISGQIGAFHTADQRILIELYMVIAVIVAEMYFRHRSNIVRLINKTERKTYVFRKHGGD